MDDLLISKDEDRGDFTFLSHSQEAYELLDHMKHDSEEAELVEEKIREFQTKNQQLRQYLLEIQDNPNALRANPEGAKIKAKMDMLQKENRRMREFITNAKLNSKPVQLERVSSGIATPRNYKKQLNFDGDSMRNSLKSNPRQRRILEQIDSNYEKVFTEASTCQNYRQKSKSKFQQPRDELGRLAPLTETQKKLKNGLKLKTQMQLRKKQLADSEIKKETEEAPMAKAHKQKINNAKALEEYKNSLLQQLRNSNIKQAQLQKIIQQLRKIHKASVDRFNQLTRMLQELKSSNEDNNQILNDAHLIERYEEALRLEEILANLHHSKEQKRKEAESSNEEELIQLKNIRRELYRIIQKIGLKVDTTNMTLQETIEAFCHEIIFNVYLPCLRSTSSTNAKLLRIKQLTEQEKAHNNEVLMELKNREQALSKKLMSMQLKKQ